MSFKELAVGTLTVAVILGTPLAYVKALSLLENSNYKEDNHVEARFELLEARMERVERRITNDGQK